MVNASNEKGTPKKAVRFHGISADAGTLGVNRSTLFRALTGEWRLPGLLARYRQLKLSRFNATRLEGNLGAIPAPGGATVSPRGADGALDNLHPEWGGVVARLGFTVVVVSLPRSEHLFQHQGFEQKLGIDLLEAKLGQYDSTIWENPRLHFFLLHTKALRAALELVQSRLAALNLLTGCRIGRMDSADKVWRTVFPSIEGAPAPQA